MILKAYNAPWKDNIDLFIEKNGILKGNIEGVFHDTVNHFFTLFKRTDYFYGRSWNCT